MIVFSFVLFDTEPDNCTFEGKLRYQHLFIAPGRKVSLSGDGIGILIVADPAGSGDYNQDQRTTLDAIRNVYETLAASQIRQLKDSLATYLSFRDTLEAYYLRYFSITCQTSCFETGLSACCGFESIITFFADHAINFLVSSPEEIVAICRVLEHRNVTGKCVYLGRTGCVWRVRPISCAMFLCDQVKKIVFEEYPEAESLWEKLRDQEKEFTFPTKPVLFDDLEKIFLKSGAVSPHLYFHQSPGLLRLKARVGMQCIEHPG